MEYLDEELLEAKRKSERQKCTTLETGMYAGEEKITFTYRKIPGTAVILPMPDQFIVMPEGVKNVKYPSREAPDFIMTSLDGTVNMCFSLLPAALKDGEMKELSRQYKNALQSVNPSLVIKNCRITRTDRDYEMDCLEYTGYHLDGQSYNRVYLIRLKKNVLQGVFHCESKSRNDWSEIMDKMFLAVEEK